MAESDAPHPDLRDLKGVDEGPVGPRTRAFAELANASERLLDTEAVTPGSTITVLTEGDMVLHFDTVPDIADPAKPQWRWHTHDNREPVPITLPTNANVTGGLAERKPTVRKFTPLLFLPLYTTRGGPDTPPAVRALNDGRNVIWPEAYDAQEIQTQKNIGLFVEAPDGTLYWRVADVHHPQVTPPVHEVRVLPPAPGANTPGTIWP
jgi:hypothetical protein